MIAVDEARHRSIGSPLSALTSNRSVAVESLEMLLVNGLMVSLPGCDSSTQSHSPIATNETPQ